MKLNKIYLPLVAAAALMTASCTDEVKYTPAEAAPVPEVYFPVVNTFEKDLVDGDTKVTVTVARPDSNGEKTYTLDSSVDPDATPFTIPSSVTFADGIGSVNIDITFDLADIVVNQKYVITLTLAGIQGTPYGLSTMNVELLYLPWRDFEANNSMGIYYEGGFATLFGDPVSKYEVKIQKHPLSDNIFRIINPYGPGVWPALDEFGSYDGEDHYMIINCENPKRVYVPEFFTGVTMANFGPISMASQGALFQENNDPSAVESAGYYGTYDAEAGHIKAGAKSFWSVYCSIDGKVDWYTPITNDFKVVLPGFEDIVEWEEYGMCDFTDGFLGPWFGITNNTYKVLVEHSLLDDDLYRIVNPYGVASGYAEEDPETPEYIEFSVSDPDFVVMSEYKPLLFISQTQVLYSIGTYAAIGIEYMGKSYNEMKALEAGGTIKDKVLTVSADNCVGVIANVTATGGLQLATVTSPATSCDLVLDLNDPEPVTVEPDAGTESKGKVITSKRLKYYRLVSAFNSPIEMVK